MVRYDLATKQQQLHVRVCVCAYTMEYITFIIHKDNEILPFSTTWMDLEGILHSEISQRKTKMVCDHLLLLFSH